MKIFPSMFERIFSSIAALFAAATAVSAQARPARVPEPSFFESYGLYVGIIAVAALIGAAVLLRKKKAEDAAKPVLKADDGVRLKFKEKADEPIKPKPDPFPSAVVVAKKDGLGTLPIGTMKKVHRANAFIQLPESHDRALLEAIEITGEDSEADAPERLQALKVLATFKTSNAVAAISQIALYDLSSKLRSDAVAVLSEIDHESVFEAIVTTCADPTREVRAAGARALVNLSFDRAHAWARVIESGDMARMRHTARCAVEGDLVGRSFDRLVHPDRKVAYEAFTLTALLVRAGEVEPIYDAVAQHRDENVKLALLHTLQAIKEDSTFEGLSKLLTTYNLSPKIVDKVNEVRSSLQLSHA
ncbi:MAG: hypothetical protein AB7F88_03610 [Pyrinomonadaceae bacterium]